MVSSVVWQASRPATRTSNRPKTKTVKGTFCKHCVAGGLARLERGATPTKPSRSR
jgi:hypothetical protein